MTWPTITTTRAVARTSWTKVAPDRHDGATPYHRMMSLVPNITTTPPATKIAFSFWPGMYWSLS
jgi:hypothetical protein